MPLEAYKEISALSLPIPPPTTGPPGYLHYITLEEAMLMPFTAEHQPSLANRSARSRNTTVVDGVAIVGREKLTPADASHANKTSRGNHVRGVVACKEYVKPRCLFSMDAPIRMKPTPSIHGIEPTNEEIKACREYAMH
jgi:hypothetical protein